MCKYRPSFNLRLIFCLLILMKSNIAIANDHFDMTKLDDQAQKKIKATCYFQKMDAPKVYANCLAKETQKVFSSTNHRLKTTATSTSSMPNPRWSSSADNAVTNWGGRQTASSIFENLKGSVFGILVYKSKEDLKRGKWTSQGSGVAISSNTVLTNCHVVMGGPVILLGNKQQQMTSGKIVKAKASKDACTLRVEVPLTPVPALRSYSSLEIGETVYSLGTPQGYLNTFAEGNISGLRRCDVTSFLKDKNTRCIQTSAPTSPGSSGGGLFDAAGNLVGINTYGHTGGQNLNFAVDVGEYWK